MAFMVGSPEVSKALAEAVDEASWDTGRRVVGAGRMAQPYYCRAFSIVVRVVMTMAEKTSDLESSGCMSRGPESAIVSPWSSALSKCDPPRLKK